MKLDPELKPILTADRKIITLEKKEEELSLTEWLYQNAMLGFIECENPYDIESGLINLFSPPLNVKNNPKNTFIATLEKAREKCKKAAE